MVPLSMTLSYLWPRFQGHLIFRHWTSSLMAATCLIKKIWFDLISEMTLDRAIMTSMTHAFLKSMKTPIPPPLTVKPSMRRRRQRMCSGHPRPGCNPFVRIRMGFGQSNVWSCGTAKLAKCAVFKATASRTSNNCCVILAAQLSTNFNRRWRTERRGQKYSTRTLNDCNVLNDDDDLL